MVIWLGVPALRLQAAFRGDAGVIGQGLDADHIAVDLGGDVELLLYRLGNLAAAGGKLIVKTLCAVHSSRTLLYTCNLLCQGGQQINI